MSILALLPVVFQLALKIFDVLVRTPEEKLQDVLGALNKFIIDVQEGVEHARKTDGDPGKLEDAINRRLGK